ncbi:DUF4127 family protein [Phascolarctobacterium succinatutens]|uniref:DUF4127 family protein n=1 Tax=Phascolarctobacterium succinatutens TaxID=626940 RepID=UPI003F7E35A6
MLISGICLRLTLPSSTPLRLKQQPPTQSILLLPLDSRPVCSTMVQKLGALAGLNVILPPKACLDNYRTLSDRQKLLQWLQTNQPKYDYSIISADNLLHGGLLAARMNTAAPADEDALLKQLQQFAPAKQQAIFSVIPRLLVSDQLLPDRWYQYQLMRYSQLADMVRITGSFALTQELRRTKAKIPAKVLDKYRSRYQQSDRFNLGLLKLATDDRQITFGQDDASPIGLPHASAVRLQSSIAAQKLQQQAQLTYGADEIASLLLTRYYLQQSGWQPKVYLHYASPKAEGADMPYMAVSVGAALRNQLKLMGASEASTPDSADLICYVNCGNDDFRPSAKQVQELQQMLDQGYKVALIDSSANFEAEELLLPQLLANNVPINKLAAYAAWNTFSNSSGTALAQGLLFCGRLRQLQIAGADTERLAALFAANLNFTAERILEDYYYQKLVHPQLRQKLEAFGINPVELDSEDKTATEQYIQGKLSLQAYKLLHDNLGRTPFYQQNGQSYYLRDLSVGAKLPWARIFEVELQVWTDTGVKTE